MNLFLSHSVFMICSLEAEILLKYIYIRANFFLMQRIVLQQKTKNVIFFEREFYNGRKCIQIVKISFNLL